MQILKLLPSFRIKSLRISSTQSYLKTRTILTYSKLHFIIHCITNKFSILYSKALSIKPPLHPLFSNLPEQSTSCCSDSSISLPFARKFAPSNEPVVENARKITNYKLISIQPFYFMNSIIL